MEESEQPAQKSTDVEVIENNLDHDKNQSPKNKVKEIEILEKTFDVDEKQSLVEEVVILGNNLAANETNSTLKEKQSPEVKDEEKNIHKNDSTLNEKAILKNKTKEIEILGTGFTVGEIETSNKKVQKVQSLENNSKDLVEEIKILDNQSSIDEKETLKKTIEQIEIVPVNLNKTNADIKILEKNSDAGEKQASKNNIEIIELLQDKSAEEKNESGKFSPRSSPEKIMSYKSLNGFDITNPYRKKEKRVPPEELFHITKIIDLAYEDSESHCTEVRAAVTHKCGHNEKTANFNLFSIIVIDESNISMEVKMFGVVGKNLYDSFMIGNVYIFRFFRIVEAKYGNFSRCNFEMIINSNTRIKTDLTITLEEIKLKHSEINWYNAVIATIGHSPFWILSGWVDEKSPLHLYGKHGANDVYFKIVITDIEHQSMKAVFFDETANYFYEKIEVGNLYKFSGGKIYSNSYKGNNEDELRFNIHSTIELDKEGTEKERIIQYQKLEKLNASKTWNWPVCARVLKKNPINNWENERSNGVLFSIVLYDGSGVDVNATFFNDSAKHFYAIIDEGAIYSFSGGTVKTLITKKNNCNSNVEINFPLSSKIIRKSFCSKNHLIQMHPEHFHFECLWNIFLQNSGRNKKWDLIAVVVSIGKLEEVGRLEFGGMHNRCDVVVCDDSRKQTTITLWSENAVYAANNFRTNQVVAFCPVSVVHLPFGVPNEIRCDGNIYLNPSCDKTTYLLNWWSEKNNKSFEVKSKSGIFSFTNEIERMITSIDKIDDQERNEYFKICGRVYFKTLIRQKKPKPYLYFSVGIIDASGTDIQGTFDEQDGAYKFHPLLVEGDLFVFSKFSVRSLKQGESSYFASHYEIAFDEQSEISPTTMSKDINFIDDKNLFYNFLKLNELNETNDNSKKVDVIVVVQSCSDIIQSWNTKGESQVHCDLVVFDDSLHTTTITAWNSNAFEVKKAFESSVFTPRYFDVRKAFEKYAIVAFCPIRMKTCAPDEIRSYSSVGQVYVNPDSKRTLQLQEFYEKYLHEKNCGRIQCTNTDVEPSEAWSKLPPQTFP